MASITNVVGATLIMNFVVICAGYEDKIAMFSGNENHISPVAEQQPAKRYPHHLDPTFLKFWIQVGECPESSDGAKQYFCPSVLNNGKHVCIDDYQLCNGVKECPNAEDENSNYCLFYRALKSQVELLERSMATLNSIAQPKSPVRRYVNPIHGYDDYK